jgi:hypothetical protein
MNTSFDVNVHPMVQQSVVKQMLGLQLLGPASVDREERVENQDGSIGILVGDVGGTLDSCFCQQSRVQRREVEDDQSVP